VLARDDQQPLPVAVGRGAHRPGVVLRREVHARGIVGGRDGCGDHQLTARHQPGVELGVVEDRIVGGHHDVAGPDGRARLRGQLALAQVGDPGAFEDLSTVAGQVVGQRQQVAARMELRLVLDADRRRDLERQAGVGHQRRP
jgi:hypothetical protein